MTSWIDADVRGTHGWAQGILFPGTGVESETGDEAMITCYEVL